MYSKMHFNINYTTSQTSLYGKHCTAKKVTLRETKLWKCNHNYCCYTLLELRSYVPINTKAGDFRDILPSQYISMVPKKLDLTQKHQQTEGR